MYISLAFLQKLAQMFVSLISEVGYHLFIVSQCAQVGHTSQCLYFPVLPNALSLIYMFLWFTRGVIKLATLSLHVAGTKSATVSKWK